MKSARLFAIWGILAFVLTVPTGAWAEDEEPGSMEGDPGTMAPAGGDEHPKGKDEHPTAKKKEKKPGRQEGKFGERMAQAAGQMTVDEMLAKFDTNADGALGTDELAAMRQGRIDGLLKQHGPRVMKTFDRDGDGMLSDAEQAEMDAKLEGIKQKVGEQIDVMVKRADADKDGTLSDVELERVRQFQQAREAAMASGEGGEMPARDGKNMLGKRDMMGGDLAAQFDADGDGALSKDELDKAKQQRESAVVEGERDLLLTRFDEDKDGQLNEQEAANQKEYTDLMMIEVRQKFEGLMERFDGDQDGTLSADELAAMRDPAGKRGVDKKPEGKKKKKDE